MPNLRMDDLLNEEARESTDEPDIHDLSSSGPADSNSNGDSAATRSATQVASDPITESRTESTLEQTGAQAHPQPAGTINLPRWIILAQGALLGTVAITFFLFGMMMGSITTEAPPLVDQAGMVELSGSVFVERDQRRVADMGAVVIVLPLDVSAETRPDPDLLKPETYQPIDNTARQVIQESGGQVVRVNSDGNFTSIVRQNRKYQVLVISKLGNDSSSITKQMRAELGGFFLPLEELLENQTFNWQEVVVTGSNKRLDVVLFDG